MGVSYHWHKRHWKTEIVANHVEMLSGRRKKDYAAESAANGLTAQAAAYADADGNGVGDDRGGSRAGRRRGGSRRRSLKPRNRRNAPGPAAVPPPAAGRFQAAGMP